MKTEYYILGLLIMLLILVARQNALLSEIHDSVNDVGDTGRAIVGYVEKGTFDAFLK
jgi:hypothetical protein